MPPIVESRLSGFFTERNWVCWDVGPVIFSKVTLFSLPEVFPQLQQYNFFTSLRRQLFEKKVHPRSFCAPNVKSWLRACLLQPQNI